MCEGSNFILFACAYIVVPAWFVEGTALSPLKGLGTLVKNQLAIDAWAYFWTLSSIPVVCMSLSQHHNILITIDL